MRAPMRTVVSSILAGVIALGAVAPAFADPPRRYDRDWHNNRHWARDRDWNRGHRRDRDWRDGRRNYRDGYRDARRDSRWDSRWDNHRWRKGDRWDRRDYRYVVVNDYRPYRDRYGYRLRAPRHGEYYVRDDRTGEILLIAAATGLVI